MYLLSILSCLCLAVSKMSFVLFPFSPLLIVFRVIGVDIEEWKLDLARKLGTDLVVNAKNQDIKQVLLNFNKLIEMKSENTS